MTRTQLSMDTVSPPRLNTFAPRRPDRLARTSVLATSSAYWNEVLPPNAMR